MKGRIREFIEQNLMILDDHDELQDSDNIFELGYVNSLFAMKLLSFVEAEFGIRVEQTDMDIKNFSSIDQIESLVKKKTTAAS